MSFEVLSEIFTAQNLLMMNIGLFAGVIIGAMPGLSVSFAVTVLLTMTIGMDSIPGMYMLLGGYVGGMYGGSITAILINTPGTPNAAATTLDGYPLAKKGRAGDALKAALYGSVIGGLFRAPQLAKIVEIIASPEMFAICLFGLCATISLSKDNIIKGLISALLGLMVCCVGLDPIFGTSRMLFGTRSLMAGFRSVTCMLGVYALSQVLFECNAARARGDTGGAISAMMSYNEARRASKNPEKFGKGSIEGVLAPETGNNAVTGATLIPMLTMGIPGDAIMAIMLGALTMQGITPGAKLFSAGSIWVYAIIVINIFMLIQGSAFIRLFVNVSRVPENILLPCIVVLCVMGAFAISNSLIDVAVLIAFALVGFLMKKFGIPVIPFTIALVLGNLCETNLRRALMVSYGDPMILVRRPICFGILLLSAALLIYPSISRLIKGRRSKKAGTETKQ